MITGEGRFDAQTLRGKTPFGVARVAAAHQVPVLVIAGTLDHACRHAAALLRDRARDIARVWALGRG